MSMKRERWLRGSCPVDDPAQVDARRRYEAERQNLRLARFYARDEQGCESWTRMEDAALAALEQLEGEGRCLDFSDRAQSWCDLPALLDACD